MMIPHDFNHRYISLKLGEDKPLTGFEIKWAINALLRCDDSEFGTRNEKGKVIFDPATQASFTKDDIRLFKERYLDGSHQLSDDHWYCLRWTRYINGVLNARRIQ